jgi:hypothetical protein
VCQVPGNEQSRVAYAIMRGSSLGHYLLTERTIMHDGERWTFVVPVNNQGAYETNFLASPALQGVQHDVIVQQGFASAATAYNCAIEEAGTDLIVFLHQDVYLPGGWIDKAGAAIAWLENRNLAWGVLGCWGAKEDGSVSGHMYSTGLGVLGAPAEEPARVQTLDEAVLILRKSSGVRFDERISGFHFYGAAVCMAAQEMAKASYAISAFCIHNTRQLTTLPPEFYGCYRQFKRAWRHRLPVQTSCIRVTTMDVGFHYRRTRECLLANTCKAGAERWDNPESIMSTPGVVSALRA